MESIGAREVIVVNGQEEVSPEEGIIWWGDFGRLSKLCPRPSASSFAAAVPALRDFATSEQAQRIFDTLSPDCLPRMAELRA
jgi:hypothetical protein